MKKKIYVAPSTEMLLFPARDIVTASQNDDIADDTFKNVVTAWLE